MAGPDEKQTERGWGGRSEQKEGGTDYWQCRLGLERNSASMLGRRRLSGARVARHLVAPTSEKQTRRESAKNKKPGKPHSQNQ